MKILIVDDEVQLVKALSAILKKNNYNTDCAYDGEDGLDKALSNIYDVIILDIMLPKMNGYEIIRELRNNRISTPVLMLSAKSQTYDKIYGLNLGADDYLAKPFGMMEMVSRIRAVLRRTARQPSGVLSCGGVTLDEGRHAVTVNDRPVSLTLKEYELLKLFLENIGQVFSREALLSRVWDADYAGETRTVDVHVGTLRTKLAECGGLIETVRGVGYKMEGVK